MLAFRLSHEADLQVTLMATQIHQNLQIEENKATTKQLTFTHNNVKNKYITSGNN